MRLGGRWRVRLVRLEGAWELLRLLAKGNLTFIVIAGRSQQAEVENRDGT